MSDKWVHAACFHNSPKMRCAVCGARMLIAEDRYIFCEAGCTRLLMLGWYGTESFLKQWKGRRIVCRPLQPLTTDH